jgi:hypothetical protein
MWRYTFRLLNKFYRKIMDHFLVTPTSVVFLQFNSGILGSSVRITTGLRAGRPGYDSRQGLAFFLAIASRSDLGLIQPPIQWVSGVLCPGVTQLGREGDDNSPPYSAGVKNMRSYASTPQYTFMAWCTGTASPLPFSNLIPTSNMGDTCRIIIVTLTTS